MSLSLLAQMFLVLPFYVYGHVTSPVLTLYTGPVCILSVPTANTDIGFPSPVLIEPCHFSFRIPLVYPLNYLNYRVKSIPLLCYRPSQTITHCRRFLGMLTDKWVSSRESTLCSVPDNAFSNGKAMSTNSHLCHNPLPPYRTSQTPYLSNQVLVGNDRPL